MPGSNQDPEIRKHWQQIIADYLRSGLSGSSFCRSRNVKANRFWYWKGAFDRQSKAAGNGKSKPASLPQADVQVAGMTSPKFVPVIVSEDNHRQSKAHPQAIAEIVFAGGSVFLFNGMDSGTVRIILQTLKETAN